MIKKTLLLNACPIMYILLWLPGIANRIAEAMGHPTVVLQILQASMQYVGLANAACAMYWFRCELPGAAPFDAAARSTMHR
ncbi:MAG: hypothetical protein M1832_004325 [Thelocarpon impressellum]|nr:MAG: hypothetical protein M1832_004325 [Thelocarpon impressellum]